MSGRRTPALPPRPAPLFVESRTYRLRRLRDAARALPVLALLLWLVPLLWGLPDAAPRASTALVYLFGSWVAVVAGAALLLAAVERAEARAEAGPAPGRPGGATGAADAGDTLSPGSGNPDLPARPERAAPQGAGAPPDDGDRP